MARNSKEKERFLDILASTPFISYACQRAGISRATIYRWLKDNRDFKKKVFAALKEGRENLIDIAEFALVSKIKKGELGAIKFFLANNSKRYWTREAIFEEELEKDPASAFRGPDGKIVVSKQTAQLLEKKHNSKEKKRMKVLKFPDDPDEFVAYD